MKKTDNGLAPPPRRIPVAFRLAELLPFRWRYVFTPLIVAITPITPWIQQPRAFAAVAVLTVAGIYAAQICGTRIRLGLLRWGRVADVIGSETLTDTTYYSRTTRYNVYLPVARGWTVARQRWSGPNTTTHIRYALDGQQGDLVLRGREYVDGVILADVRNPDRARCVTVTGHCTSVSVSGNGNHVTVDNTDAVSASGRGNVITYHWGSPKVANVGTSNTVQQG